MSAESLVPILARHQLDSAEVLDEAGIITSVITLWESFSVAKSQQMSKQPQSLQPISCLSLLTTESLVVRSLRDFTWDYPVYTSAGIQKSREVQLLPLLLSFLVSSVVICLVSSSPHHLCLSPHSTEGNPILLLCVVCACTHLVQWISQEYKGRHKIWLDTSRYCSRGCMTWGLVKRRVLWTRAMADILHIYTYLSLECAPPCQPSGAALWSWHRGSGPSPRVSHTLSLFLSLSLFFSGAVCFPPAVCMAASTALGCLGSGGIPISSSNHDIILPQ